MSHLFTSGWGTRVPRASSPTKSYGLRGGPEHPLAVPGRRDEKGVGARLKPGTYTVSNTGPESRVPRAASGGGGAGLRPAGADAGEGRA
jgi:hypothetical protein